MSKAYIIDKDGIIVEELVVFTTYKTPKGKMIKPKSAAEDRMLVEYSNLQKKLKALREEMKELEAQKQKEAERNDVSTRKVEEMFSRLQEQEHEWYIPGQVLSLMEQWRQSSAALTGEAYAAEAARIHGKGLGLMESLQQNKLEHLTAQAAAVARIQTLRQEIYEMSALELETGDQESWKAEIDLRTGGTLTEMEKTLDAISGRIFSGAPDVTHADSQALDAMEERLNRLPEEARLVFAQQMVREDKMQRIAGRLEDSGWELLELQRSERPHDDCTLFIQGAGQRKAAIRFQLDGVVEVLSHFPEDAYKTREKLQQLVLETIRAGGEKGKGKCMDHQPQPRSAAEEAALPEEADRENPAQVRYRTAAAARQEQRGEKV